MRQDFFGENYLATMSTQKNFTGDTVVINRRVIVERIIESLVSWSILKRISPDNVVIDRRVTIERINWDFHVMINGYDRVGSTNPNYFESKNSLNLLIHYNFIEFWWCVATLYIEIDVWSFFWSKMKSEYIEPTIV